MTWAEGIMGQRQCLLSLTDPLGKITAPIGLDDLGVQRLLATLRIRGLRSDWHSRQGKPKPA